MGVYGSGEKYRKINGALIFSIPMRTGSDQGIIKLLYDAVVKNEQYVMKLRKDLSSQ